MSKITEFLGFMALNSVAIGFAEFQFLELPHLPISAKRIFNSYRLSQNAIQYVIH